MKTPEQVIAKLQRSAEARAKHLMGLIDRNATLRYEVRELEDTLVWLHRKLTKEYPTLLQTKVVAHDDLVARMVDGIEKRIPRRIRRDDQGD